MRTLVLNTFLGTTALVSTILGKYIQWLAQIYDHAKHVTRIKVWFLPTVLYYVLTGKGEVVSVAWLLESLTPYMWASMGIGFAVALSVVGAAV